MGFFRTHKLSVFVDIRKTRKNGHQKKMYGKSESQHDSYHI